MKHKANRKKGIIESKTKINKIENRKTTKKINDKYLVPQKHQQN